MILSAVFPQYSLAAERTDEERFHSPERGLSACQTFTVPFRRIVDEQVWYGYEDEVFRFATSTEAVEETIGNVSRGRMKSGSHTRLRSNGYGMWCLTAGTHLLHCERHSLTSFRRCVPTIPRHCSHTTATWSQRTQYASSEINRRRDPQRIGVNVQRALS
jgi:hypothetical protein